MYICAKLKESLMTIIRAAQIHTVFYNQSISLALELSETAPCSCQAQTNSYIKRLQNNTGSRLCPHIDSYKAKGRLALFDRGKDLSMNIPSMELNW